MTYEPTLASLRTHQVPQWYHDAKLGIFIHWGIYSVPGWAPMPGNMAELIATQGWQAVYAQNPYAEWYLNALKFEGSPTRRHHDATYGPDFPYEGFAPLFAEAVKDWDPAEWATLFEQAGARYAVLTTKHHDGYTLWPTATPCPHKVGYAAQRDLVGDLADALRARALKLGLYYSGGLDWAWNEAPIQQMTDMATTIVQTPEFVEYVNGHWRELFERYAPAVMWGDIGYPAAANLLELFADYYNRVPDGVINERFYQLRPEDMQLASENMRLEDIAAILRGPHYDFVTPEYASKASIQTQKWETCRGIGHSFGYNRNEGEGEYASVDELVCGFVDVVSKNGNMLLGVGPMADGTIPVLQRERLLGLGKWLAVNGEAIYGTRPWERAEGVTASGVPVRYTQTADALYAILLDTPEEQQVVIQDLQAPVGGTVALLGHAGPLAWEQIDTGMAVTWPENVADAPAHAIKISK